MANQQVVKRVLIGKDVAVGSPSTPLALTAGAIAIYDQNNALVTGTISINDSDRLVIVQGVGSTDINGLQSGIIYGKNVTGWSGVAYTAAIKKIAYVGYNGSTGSIEVNNNRTYSLSIINLSDQNNVNNFDRYYYQTGITGATQKIIAEGLASKIIRSNGQNSKTVVNIELVGDGSGGSSTVVTTDGYTVTTTNYTSAINIGVKISDANNNDNFQVTFSEDNQLFNRPGLDTTTISYVAVGYSNGSSTDVYSLEQANLGYRGTVNRVWFPITPETFAVTGTNYNLYMVSMEADTSGNLTSSRAQTEVIIAVPTTVTLWSKIAFETSMNDYMFSLGKGFAPVNL